MNSIKRAIFKNSLWLVTGEGISRLFMFFLMVYAAQLLGPTNFGVFSFGLAFVSIFLIFSNFGLAPIITRELVKDKKNEREYPAILSLKFLLSIFAFFLIFIFSFFLSSDFKIRQVIWILGIYILLHHFLVIIYAFFRARQKMKYEAGVRILEAILIIILGLIFLNIIPSVETLSYVFLTASLTTVMIILTLFSIFIRPISFNWDLNIWKRYLKLSWPLGLTIVFITTYIYIDSVMMGFWGQITQVGWYNAAYKIAGALIIPSTLIGASFFPTLNRFFNQSKENFKETFNSQVKIMASIALPIAIGGAIFAPQIINLFYSAEFAPAVLAFRFLAIMAGLNYLYTPFYLALVVSNNQKKIFYITLTAASANIILNLILIPEYSLYGAGAATLITYIILVVLVIKYYADNFKIRQKIT